jgi:TolB-like protein
MDCGDAGHILLSRHIAEDLGHYRQWQPDLHDLGECSVKHGARIHVVNFYNKDLGNPELPEKFKRGQGARGLLPGRISPSGLDLLKGRWALIVAALAIVSALAVAIPRFLHRSSIKPASAFASKRSPVPEAAVPEKSIAVLPFENRSDDKQNAYFADGIQGEILTRLASIADLKVISRTSTQQYQSKPRNLREIAKQFGVANIVEGRVQKVADHVRVNVQLVNAQTDSQLWAESYDRKLTDIFVVQSEIAKEIAASLQAKLTGQEEQVITGNPTGNVQAYGASARSGLYAENLPHKRQRPWRTGISQRSSEARPQIRP